MAIVKPSLALAPLLGGALLVADVLGWRVIAPLFDRERHVSGSR